MQYEDFDIDIDLSEGNEYSVSVLRSPAGEAHAKMLFPFNELVLENRLLQLQNALLRSGGKHRQVLSPEQKAVKEFGQALFDMLMIGEIRSRYDVSQHESLRARKGLRLRLRIRSPKLAALPWEFLYDARENEYLVLSRNRPIVRYLELPQPVQTLEANPPLQVLGMVASPNNLQKLDIEGEKQRVENALSSLQQRGLAQLTWLTGQTWRDLQRAMRAGPWHIFHFIGHGGFDTDNDEGLIALVGEQEQAHFLEASHLGQLLANHSSLRLVLLNVCESARGGQRDIFSSTASILVRRGIPAVLGMQYSITDQAALEFSRLFYEALSDGIPIDAAVCEARVGVNIAISNTVEWGVPVLYTRAPDGVLFTIQKQQEVKPKPPKPKTTWFRTVQIIFINHIRQCRMKLQIRSVNLMDFTLKFVKQNLSKMNHVRISKPKPDSSRFGTLWAKVKNALILSNFLRERTLVTQTVDDSTKQSFQYPTRKNWFFLGLISLIFLIISISVVLYQNFVPSQQSATAPSITPTIGATAPGTFATTKIRIRLASTSDWLTVRIASPIITQHHTINRSGQPRESTLDGMSLRLAQSLQKANDANLIEITEEITLANLSETHPLALAITMGCIGKTVIEVFNSMGSTPILVDRHVTNTCSQTIDYFTVAAAPLLARTPTPFPTIHPNEIDFLRGASFLGQFKYAQALALFDIAVSSGWKNPELFLLRSAACIELAKISEECSLSKALDDLNYAIELAPDNSQVYQRRATVLMEQGKPAEAVTDLVRAITLQPNDLDLYLDRAQAYVKSSNTPNALQDVDKAIEIDPTSYKPYILKGKIYSEQLNDYNSALEAYNKSIDLCPKTDPTAYFERGIYYIQLQNWQAAVADMTHANQIYPDGADIYGHRGNAYAQLNEIDMARSDYSIFLELTNGKPSYNSWRKLVEEWMLTH